MSGEADSAENLVSLALDLQPSLVVMDADFPGWGGAGACRRLTAPPLSCYVLALAGTGDRQAVTELAVADASGIVHNGTGGDALLAAARAMASGEYRLPGWLVREMVAKFAQTVPWQEGGASPAPPPLPPLTTVEQWVLTMFASGRSYVQIAGAIGKSYYTVRNHIYRIRNRLGLRNSQEIVLWAERNGMLGPMAGAAEERVNGNGDKDEGEDESRTQD